jgi:hypothetical protein
MVEMAESLGLSDIGWLTMSSQKPIPSGGNLTGCWPAGQADILTHAFSPDGYIRPCIPTRAHKASAGSDWVHEIKDVGYRLQVRRDGDTVRLFA